MVAKFGHKVSSQRTAKIENLVVLSNFIATLLYHPEYIRVYKVSFQIKYVLKEEVLRDFCNK